MLCVCERVTFVARGWFRFCLCVFYVIFIFFGCCCWFRASRYRYLPPRGPLSYIWSPSVIGKEDGRRSSEYRGAATRFTCHDERGRTSVLPWRLCCAHLSFKCGNCTSETRCESLPLQENPQRKITQQNIYREVDYRENGKKRKREVVLLMTQNREKSPTITLFLLLWFISQHGARPVETRVVTHGQRARFAVTHSVMLVLQYLDSNCSLTLSAIHGCH